MTSPQHQPYAVQLSRGETFCPDLSAFLRERGSYWSARLSVDHGLAVPDG